MKYIKWLELPHVSYWKNRWVRRVMIVLTLPQELIRANYSVFAGAALWWKQPNT